MDEAGVELLSIKSAEMTGLTLSLEVRIRRLAMNS